MWSAPRGPSGRTADGRAAPRRWRANWVRRGSGAHGGPAGRRRLVKCGAQRAGAVSIRVASASGAGLADGGGTLLLGCGPTVVGYLVRLMVERECGGPGGR